LEARVEELSTQAAKWRAEREAAADHSYKKTLDVALGIYETEIAVLKWALKRAPRAEGAFAECVVRLLGTQDDPETRTKQGHLLPSLYSPDQVRKAIMETGKTFEQLEKMTWREANEHLNSCTKPKDQCDECQYIQIALMGFKFKERKNEAANT
jgi:hypothetical protein